MPGGNGQHWEGECLKKGMEWGKVYWEEEELKIKAELQMTAVIRILTC